MDRLSRFEETLASVLRYRCDSAQIIVAHNGVYDDPYGLGKEVDFVGTESSDDSPSELITRMNAAIKIARGEIVVCLRPGIQLTENWDRPVAAAFADPAVGSLAPAIVNHPSDQRLVAAGVAGGLGFNRKLVGVGQRINSRRLSKLKPWGPSSWAAFYRRSLLAALGECDAQLDAHYVDLDLALSFQALNFECVFCPECTVTIDDPTSIADEARLAHGRSAQRATTRFNNLASDSQRLNSSFAILREIALSPWRPAYLKHAMQRFGAGKYRLSDQHHRDLLAVLQSQRARLLTPERDRKSSAMPVSDRSARRAA